MAPSRTMKHVGNVLSRLARAYGTPCFVYFAADIDHRLDQLSRAFGGRFEISYAVKSNPNQAILKHLAGRIPLLDISSAGELDRALAAGWDGSRVSFTGPAKRAVELAAAVENRIGAVVVESMTEARLLDEAVRSYVTRPPASTEPPAPGKERAQRQPVLIRISPAKMPRGFGIGMAGKPVQFGIDEEDLDPAVEAIRELTHLDLRGFHIYSGTQCLDAEAIIQNYANFVAVFRGVCENHDIEPETLIFGSGLGIPYHAGDEPLDLATVARGTNPVLDELKSLERFSNTRFVLELGRHLVGEAGYYVTGVVNIKLSRGTKIAICDGGMNHHLGACGHLGSIIHRNYPMFRAGSAREDEGAAAAPQAAGASPPLASDGNETYNLVGPLCTSIDTLGMSVELPRLEIGDLVAVGCSGAYGPSASPIDFISHPPAKELFVVEHDGEMLVEDITERAPISLDRPARSVATLYAEEPPR